MRNEIDYSIIANDIKMSRDGGSLCPFIVVEGEFDYLLLRSLFREECEIKVSYGRQYAIEIIKDVELLEYRGILSILDRDYSDVLGYSEYVSRNILYTDVHDMETLVLLSPALEKIVGYYGSGPKLRALNTSIRNLLRPSGEFLGYLRLYSIVKKLALDFDLLELRDYIDRNTLEINRRAVVNKLLVDSGKDQDKRKVLNSINRDDMLREIEALAKVYSEVGPWFICCGHDLIKILSIGMCRRFGNLRTSDTDLSTVEGANKEGSSICRALMLAYEKRYFAETKLFSQIIELQETDSRFLYL